MKEIWIPELFVILFLLLSLLRPLIKGLWPLEGLVWLPLLSLAVTLGLYPAYGFRPETLPLLFLEILLNVLNIPALAASLHTRPSDAFHDRGPFFTVTALAFLAAAGVLALGFSPQISPELAAGAADTLTIRDEGRNRDYFLRIYRPSAESRPLPLLFVIPPEPGSITAVDRICAGLRDRGFRVVSYSRRGFDFPAVGEKGRKYWPSPLRLRDFWAVFRGGWKYQKANARGRVLETARREDVAFLLPRISQNRGPGGLSLFPARAPAADTRELPELPVPWGETGILHPEESAAGPEDALILIGYGAGGGALVSLAASPDFASLAAPVPVQGIIAVEPGLWHGYEEEEQPLARIPGDADWFLRLWTEIRNRFIRLKPRRVHISRRALRPSVPVLYLLSDRSLAPGPGGNRYGAIYETLRNSPGPVAAASLEGAGPLDYTAVPLIWPIFPAFFPGMAKTGRRGQDMAETTVQILGGFSALLGSTRLSGGTTGPNGDVAVPGLHIEGNAAFKNLRPLSGP